jgi:hypothetical protein
MTEGVKFWLDNKSVAGIRVANNADQVLVGYRSRFYLVADGAAVMKGGKPLRYSQTTLPAAWKKILKDDAATTAATTTAAVTPNAVPAEPVKSTRTRKARVNTASEEAPMSEPTLFAPPSEAPEKPHKAARKAAKTVNKPADKPAAVPAVNPPAQTSVPVDCPYCQQHQDLPVEKGRSGKPFFHYCAKCREEFAVRFEQVTVFRAQVAGFR